MNQPPITQIRIIGEIKDIYINKTEIRSRTPFRACYRSKSTFEIRSSSEEGTLVNINGRPIHQYIPGSRLTICNGVVFENDIPQRSIDRPLTRYNFTSHGRKLILGHLSVDGKSNIKSVVGTNPIELHIYAKGRCVISGLPYVKKLEITCENRSKVGGGNLTNETTNPTVQNQLALCRNLEVWASKCSIVEKILCIDTCQIRCFTSSKVSVCAGSLCHIDCEDNTSGTISVTTVDPPTSLIADYEHPQSPRASTTSNEFGVSCTYLGSEPFPSSTNNNLVRHRRGNPHVGIRRMDQQVRDNVSSLAGSRNGRNHLQNIAQNDLLFRLTTSGVANSDNYSHLVNFINNVAVGPNYVQFSDHILDSELEDLELARIRSLETNNAESNYRTSFPTKEETIDKGIGSEKYAITGKLHPKDLIDGTCKGDTCTICLVKAANVTLAPCSHQLICSDCIGAFRAMDCGSRCPSCRKIIVHALISLENKFYTGKVILKRKRAPTKKAQEKKCKKNIRVKKNKRPKKPKNQKKKDE